MKTINELLTMFTDRPHNFGGGDMASRPTWNLTKAQAAWLSGVAHRELRDAYADGWLIERTVNGKSFTFKINRRGIPAQIVLWN